MASSRSASSARRRSRLGAVDARGRPLGPPLLHPAAAARGSRADGRTGLGFAGLTSFWPLLLVAFVGTLNPEQRRRQHLHAARPHDARERAPATRARRCSRATASSARSPARSARSRPGCRTDGFPWNLTMLDALRLMFLLYAAVGVAVWLLYLRLPDPHAEEHEAQRAARAVARHRVAPRRPLQRRFVRRRPGGQVAACAVAVPALRHVARRRRRLLLLDGTAGGMLPAGRGTARPPHRHDQHDGVHAHPVELVPHRRGARALAACLR